MEKYFKRQIDELENIFKFVELFIVSNNIEKENTLPVKLAIEELFTNLVKYNFGGRETISIRLDFEDEKIIMHLKDYDVEPFDIGEYEPANIEKPLEERKVGGLGIHLVKSFVDSLMYEFEDRTLHVTVIKNLGDGNV
jgi:serine/threonine-protein kinase RsbW